MLFLDAMGVVAYAAARATISDAVTIDLGPGGHALGAVEVGILLELRPAWMCDAPCREHPGVSFYATARSNIALVFRGVG